MTIKLTHPNLNEIKEIYSIENVAEYEKILEAEE